VLKSASKTSHYRRTVELAHTSPLLDGQAVMERWRAIREAVPALVANGAYVFGDYDGHHARDAAQRDPAVRQSRGPLPGRARQ
jgi:hypothetical protein